MKGADAGSGIWCRPCSFVPVDTGDRVRTRRPRKPKNPVTGCLLAHPKKNRSVFIAGSYRSQTRGDAATHEENSNMNRTKLAVALAALLVPGAAFAADHVDSPNASADPSADITDVFAWMTPDAGSLNLALGVTPFAGADATFSDSVTYAFHVGSSAGYGEPQTETLVTCQFYAEDRIECWVGDEYVEGDPSDPAGITNAAETVRVFAGLRDDPFYFELAGFQQAVGTVQAVAAGLTFDDANCPILDEETAGSVVGMLQGNGEPIDTLAGANVLALVVQVDKSLVTEGGPLLSVWASTHRGE
jgi:hypothetical protein